MGLVPALIEGGTAIASALIGHHAATTAAGQQVTAARQASAGLQQPVDIGNAARMKQAAMFGIQSAPAIASAARAMMTPSTASPAPTVGPPTSFSPNGVGFQTVPMVQPMTMSAFANPQGSIPVGHGGIPVSPPTASAFRRTP